MNYLEAVKYIEGLNRFGIKLGLSRVKKLLEIFGNPHRDLKFIHVGGTNGKGSTAAMIAHIIGEAGYSVGLYTSPHINSYRERISVNEKLISREDFSEIVSSVSAASQGMKKEEHPTEFEVLTAAALEYFRSVRVDIAVIEVGMGGRFDATNIIPSSEVSIITNISRDHAKYLGWRKKDIAREKAAIIKEKSALVTAEEDSELMRLFFAQCAANNCEFYFVGNRVAWKGEGIREKSDSLVQQCSLYGELFQLGKLHLRMLGSHQIINAATALLSAEVLNNKGYKIKLLDVKNGLEKTRCPARTEVFNLNPLVILDAAHNSGSMKVLKEILEEVSGVKRVILIISMFDDKEKCRAAEILGRFPSSVIITKPIGSFNRIQEWRNLGHCFSRYSKDVYLIKHIEAAVQFGIELSGEDGCLCITGSFSIMNRARKALYNISYS